MTLRKDNLEGIELDIGSDGLHLIQRIRDEAHRFAQRYHHKLREKRFSGSILEEAPGIGKKRRTALLEAFGSYDRVKTAQKSAEALRKWLDTSDES